LLDSEEYSLAKSDIVKKLHRVTPILGHSEVPGNLMKAFDHSLCSKGRNPGNVFKCPWGTSASETYRMHPEERKES
jgi:hypothetical protein